MSKSARKDQRPAKSPGETILSRFLRSELATDLRAVLFPTDRWHYLVHVFVVVVASWYWISALWIVPGASWAELALYRQGGDTQLYPVISSLSRFNFGDPVDALKYGEGIISFPVMILLPHALAYAAFGPAGYMIMDAVMPWCYFVATILLLRRCNFSSRAALITAALMATGTIRVAASHLAEWYQLLLDPEAIYVWAQGWPNLFELPIYGTRIHRPQVTEIILVLALHASLGVWRAPHPLTAARGALVGVILGLLFQGNLYAVAALGLVLVVITLRTSRLNRWRFPWAFVFSGLTGALAVSWLVPLQRIFMHPDIAGRFGLVNHPRWPPLWLPGFGWIVLIVIVIVMGSAVWLLAFRASRIVLKGTPSDEIGPRISQISFAQTAPASYSVATFFPVLMLCAGFAQPIQVLLTGQTIQVYHYLYNLSVFYAYSAVILGLNLVFLVWERIRPLSGVTIRWRMLGNISLVLLLAGGACFATEISRNQHRCQTNPRGASGVCEPWSYYGEKYRPALRDLEREFQQNPALRNARTFTSFNHDVFVLLTAFHNKRAVNPDAFASTLSDEEIEDRLISTALLFQLAIPNFEAWLTHYYMLNYFLGCNKYRLATDYRFSKLEGDYSKEVLESMADPRFPKQDGWILVLPKSEGERLAGRYAAHSTYVDTSDPALPEIIVTCPEHLELRGAFALHPALYELTYTNTVFDVYRLMH